MLARAGAVQITKNYFTLSLTAFFFLQSPNITSCMDEKCIVSLKGGTVFICFLES